MEFYQLHPETPQQRYITKAVEVLRKGGIIIYPTDTVYGIGCDIYNKAAVQQIYKIKNVAETKLFSFIIPDLKSIAFYARVSDYAYKVMKKLLPGPYTFVLPASKNVPKKLWTKRKTVGIRVPGGEIARKIAYELGNPIISTSVTNRKGDVLYHPSEIRAIFNNQIDLMLANGALLSSPSTIISIEDNEAEVIREGAGDISPFL
jgi:tRNA threonylcarbamoyl adenosine modification protein (Sua5/YciO/YrdC/YwlC family)